MKAVRDKIARLSLRKKLFTSILICLLIPSLIALYVSNIYTKGIFREQAVQNTKESLNIVNLYISNIFNEMLNISNNLLLDSDTANLLKRLSKLPKNNDEFILNNNNITRKLQTMAMSDNSIYITILFPNGSYFSNFSEQTFNASSFMKEPWFAQLNSMSLYDADWIGLQPNYISSRTADSPKVITLARVLRAGTAAPYAYILVSFEEKQIHDFFNQYVPSKELLLMDSQNNVISRSKSIKSGTPFPYNENKGSLLAQQFLKVNGEEYVVLRQQLKIPGWQLVCLTPYQNAIERILFIRKTDFMFHTAFLLLFILILVFVVRRITKPLILLGKVASHVERGSMKVRTNIRGQDEIGRLGHVFDRMLDRIEQVINQINEEQARKRKAELELLQAQINPHFLFNILNSIRLRIMLRGDKESAELILSLSTLLRMTINRNNEFVSLHEEVKTVEHYVKLLQFRHEEAIDFDIQVASEVLLEEVPRFTIQPLIENAFIHGLQQISGAISIQAWGADKQLHILVKDNGAGMTEERLIEVRDRLQGIEHELHVGAVELCGIGLQNLYERNRMIYGPDFRMEINSILSQGTDISLVMPKKRREVHV